MTDTTANMEQEPSKTVQDESIEDISNANKESEAENVDAIKKFIEDQEKEIKEKEQENDAKIKKGGMSKIEVDKEEGKEIIDDKIEDANEEHQEENLAVAASVMHMILSESEARIAKKKDVKSLSNQSLSPNDKGNSSMALSVGSKVEARDFGEFWHSAQIVEVDYEEMEVLVHYENDSKKHDEWISVSSPRLRPIGSLSQSASVGEAKLDISSGIKEEPKSEEKPKLTYTVGERCLARWRDNRRFVATISNDLGNGYYEIIFDDGFQWKCNTSRLYKLKKPSGKSSDVLSIDTSSSSPTLSVPSPVHYGAGPSTGPTPESSNPAYHTHLFDPTRDYLGSKSERREMKRKLNIKEIFNIGQKRRRKQKSPKDKVTKKMVLERKPRVMKRKLKLKPSVEIKERDEVKKEVPDAVAAIIGTIKKDENVSQDIKSENVEIKINIDKNDLKQDFDDVTETSFKETINTCDFQNSKHEVDPVIKEEEKLEKFEKEDDVKREAVIDRIKEVITKLEDNISRVERIDSPKPEPKKEEAKLLETETATSSHSEKDIDIDKAKDIDNVNDTSKALDTDKAMEIDETNADKDKAIDKDRVKKPSKFKKGRKLRLLQEKKVKKQVEKVKSELEEMKKQVEEMRKQMLFKTDVLSNSPQKPEMPESFLLPGEWCCKWVNGQPVGTVSEIECEVKVDSNSKPALPRRSVQVEDKRLPPGWTKHMVRRSLGHSAGKWDVVLVSPDNRRYHTKTDMRNFLENNPDETLKSYENALLDFGVHLKLSRRMGWVTNTPGGLEDNTVAPLPAGILSSTSPLVKRRKLSLKKKHDKIKAKRSRKIDFNIKLSPASQTDESIVDQAIDPIQPGPSEEKSIMEQSLSVTDTSLDSSTLEDGFVFVGSLKVQIIENLLRCPAEGCYKNFRNNTLLQMHIKHYHRELRKLMGATPKVLDLAYARTMPTETEVTKMKNESESKTIKVKITKPPKRVEEPKLDVKDVKSELQIDITPSTSIKPETEKIPRSQDSPKLRNALINKPVKRPKVLLPVRRVEPTLPMEQTIPEVVSESMPEIKLEQKETPLETIEEVPDVEQLDFEAAISTHTVTKPSVEKKRRADKKRKSFATISKKPISEDEEWCVMNSDVETRSSFPRSGTPDSKNMDGKIETLMQPMSSESNEDQKDSNMYMYTENGERIKIVHMKREEIINCHCGFREEDGLMVQCELCLCWQHALCHNIQRESEVPEKYTCSICLNPRRGRRSQRFLHDQDRLYEGLLPGAKPCESLRRSHELSGNLLRIEDALHALRVKYYVATKKDHPKLYLWAKDWENGEMNLTQEKLNSDYSDLNVMISNIGKENLPIKPEEIRDIPLDMRTPPSEEQDNERFTQREGQLGSQSLLSGLLSSPGGASLDLPISTSELERLAKSVQEQEAPRVGITAPQPEAAIENSACRERLLRHIQRCQALIDARLDSIEAQVAELESQDPSFEDDETADYFPRTKQTIQMLLRDLDTMEELGVIT